MVKTPAAKIRTEKIPIALSTSEMRPVVFVSIVQYYSILNSVPISFSRVFIMKNEFIK